MVNYSILFARILDPPLHKLFPFVLLILDWMHLFQVLDQIPRIRALHGTKVAVLLDPQVDVHVVPVCRLRVKLLPADAALVLDARVETFHVIHYYAFLLPLATELAIDHLLFRVHALPMLSHIESLFAADVTLLRRLLLVHYSEVGHHPALGWESLAAVLAKVRFLLLVHPFHVYFEVRLYREPLWTEVTLKLWRLL